MVAPLLGARLGLEIAPARDKFPPEIYRATIERRRREPMRLEHDVARLHLIAHEERREAIWIAPIRRAASTSHDNRDGSSFSGSVPIRYWYAPRLSLVDRTCDADQVAKMSGRAFAIGGESLGGFRVFPSAVAGDPSRRSEMMKRHDRRYLVFVARREHAAIVIERRNRKLARLRFDSRPFNRKAVRVEAEPREHRDVFRVAMVLVARIARRLKEGEPGVCSSTQ